ncbi:MAG: hypothetical protein HKN39_04265 [Flavobacteriales bacterium]|nr:hypothetical protein [Flavobacteriales bacterium]
MTRYFYILLLVTLPFTYSYGQGESKPKFKDRIYFGGNVGLNLGTITFIDVSPLVGYKLSDKYSVGSSFTYQYYKDKQFDVSGNVLGGSVFNRYNATDELFIWGEYQLLSYSGLNSTFSENENPRNTVPYLWLGGGYSQRISGRASIFVTILYDVIDNIESRISNPQIRGGIAVGI